MPNETGRAGLLLYLLALAVWPVNNLVLYCGRICRHGAAADAGVRPVATPSGDGGRFPGLILPAVRNVVRWKQVPDIDVCGIGNKSKAYLR